MNSALKQAFAWLEQGRYQQAHSWAIEAIKADINNAYPFVVLARIAADHGNHIKAPELFARAQTLAPADPVVAGFHGQYLLGLGDHPGASRVVIPCTPASCDDGFIADLIGVIFSRLGLHARAVPFFQRAIALNSQPANFYYNLGASLQFSGEIDAAEQAYGNCLQRDPLLPRAWTARTSLRKQTSEIAQLKNLKQLFTKASDADAQLHFAHAIAKTLEDFGEYGESLDWLSRGKAIKRATLNYTVEEDLALFSAAAATLRQPLPTPSEAALSDGPIFIVGLPRTGTTLVDRIITSHSSVVSAGELNTFAALVKKRAGTTSNRVLDTETMRSIAEQDISDLGVQYQRDVAHLRQNAPYFTDKMPLNFFYASLLLKAMPNARIIALRRDPMDSCLSNFRQLFSTGFSYYNYALSLADTARYYLAFDALMDHWRTVLPASRFAEFTYEDIVVEQEVTSRRLINFLGLPWEDECLNFHQNKAPVSTASSVQVRQPIYTGSIGRWRRYGSAMDALQRALTLSERELG